VIWDAIFGLLDGVMSWLLSLLPEAGEVATVSLAPLAAPFAWLNLFLPLSELLGFVAFLVALRAVVLGARTALFVYHQFWGSN